MREKERDRRKEREGEGEREREREKEMASVTDVEKGNLKNMEQSRKRQR